VRPGACLNLPGEDGARSERRPYGYTGCLRELTTELVEHVRERCRCEYGDRPPLRLSRADDGAETQCRKDQEPFGHLTFSFLDMSLLPYRCPEQQRCATWWPPLAALDRNPPIRSACMARPVVRLRIDFAPGRALGPGKIGLLAA